MAGTKERVLKYLEQNKGTFSSGEMIAGELSLSRNSVWKAIESLRRDGYQIEAASRRGYSLTGEHDFLSVPGIQTFLKSKISPEQIFIHDSLESTNKSAKSAASFDAAHGTVIIAKSQKSGSGRKNHTFFSPPGGIYMSIVLRPESLPFSNPALITSYSCVSICKALEKLTDLKPSIKWINDIYLDNRKICGILTESGTDFESGELQWIVVGIGINFSISEKDFPGELKQKAGSIFIPGEETISKNHLIAEILNQLFPLNDGSAVDAPAIISDYRSRMNILGKKITVHPINGISYPAKALDINENGKLLIELPDGSTSLLSSEEISVTL